MIWTIEKRLLVYLIAGFIVATIIGTVSHELGHYIVARGLGYDAHISYQSVNWAKTITTNKINLSDSFYITLGGPLQTMLTGTIGFILLFVFRKSFEQTNRLSFGQWTLIFITLFWLRQIANFVVLLTYYIFSGKLSARGDEIKMSRYLQVPDWTIIAITALIGAGILGITIFEFVPKIHRLTFILSGLIGGVAGYMIWLEWFGKLLMP
jgi:hypothetical protein